LAWDPNKITAAWLGHSTVLINFYGLTILTDPVLFSRIGVDLRLATVGPKRLVRSALTWKALPPIDLILLSHAHFDHLDLSTLKRFSASTQVVTAHSTADLLEGTRLRHVEELSWGNKTTIKTTHGELLVHAFTVKHWGARVRRDTFRGYNGYVLAREGKRIIFGGDTAMSDSFRALRPSGPFELAIMPIGAYQPWIRSHCTPEEAVAMANAAGAEHLLPVHHKTFLLGREAVNEPIQRLEAAIESERLALRDIGETFVAA
jgi:L-ascorbate metabolism protein UlaG (beta-lactamase superfamily)